LALLLVASPVVGHAQGATTTTYQQPAQQEEGGFPDWLGYLGLLGLAGLLPRKGHTEVRRTTTRV
jgi:hypothetical protein